MLFLLLVLTVILVVVAIGIVGLVALGRATGSAWVPIGIVAVPMVLMVGFVLLFFTVSMPRQTRIETSYARAAMEVERATEREIAAHRLAAEPDGIASSDLSTTGVTSSPERPAWVDAAESRVGDRIRVKLEAGPYTGLAACDRELNQRLIEVAQEHVAKTLGDKMASSLDVSPAWLRENVVVDEYDDVTKHAFGPGAEHQPMYHAYMLVEFDDVADRYLMKQARQATVGHRLVVAGFLVVGVLVVLTTLFGYLKTDQATEQKYTGRLKLAAGSVILATVGAAMVLLA